MNRFRCQGFSLLEALMSLFLIGLAVVLSAGLLNNMSTMSNRSQSGEQAVNGLLALERMRAELLEAVSVISPASSSLMGELVFTKINPAVSNRLSLPTTPWLPARPAHCLTVKYEVLSGALIRTVTPHSGSAVKTVVARSVDGFSASAGHSVTPAVGVPDVITLKISFSKGKVLESHTTFVKRLLP